jgi:beta-lactamase regulating signal transducer with metallopeptidase domain
MENITEFFSNPLAKTLGWTLVHSLWQILAITLVYFAIVLFTKKASYRYWSGMSLLLLQFMASGITFFVISAFSSSEKTFAGVALAPKMLSSVQVMLSYLQTNLPLVVGIWVLGCAILFSRLILGYLWVNSLKNSPKNQFDEKLTQILLDIKQKMNITKNVQVKVSRIVSLPMIMGVLKPVILIPAGLVSGFSQEQLETILAHELAHLKRHDFLLNGLQSVLDVIYFFHPAMWLLSAQIRKERENCCDDLALEVSGSKLLLAKTLVQLQETIYTPKLAMAFGKKSYSLLERVQRIVGIGSPRNFNKESIWIVAGLFVTFFAFAQKNEEQRTVSTSISRSSSTADTLISPKRNETSIVIQDSKNDFRIKDNKIFYNGKEVQLSPEVQEKVNVRLKAVEVNQQQMEVQSKLMEEQSHEMEKFSSQMEVNSKPMEELSKQMEEDGKKMELASKKHELALKSKNLTKKDEDLIWKTFESQIAEYDKEMEQYNIQMDEYASQMDKVSAPMDAISAKMDEISVPMDAISVELDRNVNEIIDLMPAEIRSSILKDRLKTPVPPKAPKAPKSLISPNAPKGIISPKIVPSPPTPPKKKKGLIRSDY